MCGHVCVGALRESALLMPPPRWDRTLQPALLSSRLAQREGKAAHACLPPRLPVCVFFFEGNPPSIFFGRELSQAAPAPSQTSQTSRPAPPFPPLPGCPAQAPRSGCGTPPQPSRPGKGSGGAGKGRGAQEAAPSPGGCRRKAPSELRATGERSS